MKLLGCVKISKCELSDDNLRGNVTSIEYEWSRNNEQKSTHMLQKDLLAPWLQLGAGLLVT